jgi:hypothetical protein
MYNALLKKKSAAILDIIPLIFSMSTRIFGKSGLCLMFKPALQGKFTPPFAIWGLYKISGIYLYCTIALIDFLSFVFGNSQVLLQFGDVPNQ